MRNESSELTTLVLVTLAILTVAFLACIGSGTSAAASATPVSSAPAPR